LFDPQIIILKIAIMQCTCTENCSISWGASISTTVSK